MDKDPIFWMLLTGGKKTEITVNNGAEENACPWDCEEEFGLNQVSKKLVFRWIEHYGGRKVFVHSPF